MTIPAPTARPVHIDSYTRKPQRARIYSWDLNAATLAGGQRYITLTVGAGEKARLELRILHSASHKTFLARVGQVVDTGPGAYVSSPLDDVTIHAAPVARYSEKALDAYAAQVLALLPVLIDSDVKVAAAFRPLVGERVTVDGHTPVVQVEKHGHLSNYACSCGQMERFSGYSLHREQRARFDAHLADVAPQAEELTPQRLDREAQAEAYANSLPLPADVVAALTPDFLATV